MSSDTLRELVLFNAGTVRNIEIYDPEDWLTDIAVQIRDIARELLRTDADRYLSGQIITLDNVTGIGVWGGAKC